MKLKKKIDVKKSKRKTDRSQPGLTFQTNGLIHETGIIFSKKNYKAQFLTNLILNDEIKKKLKKT